MDRRDFITSAIGMGAGLAAAGPAHATTGPATDGASGAGARSPAKTRAVTFDERKIDAIFADLDQARLPGAAVGIALGGKPVYRKGFGLASMELPVALSPTIRMRASLTTRHFTSLAYLLLCEEGKAGIDDPLGKWFPEFHRVTHKVTLRQLMANTSCLRDPFDVCFQFSGTGRGVTGADLLALYRSMDDVNAAAGTSFNYNHGDFLLVGAAIERITGKTLDEVLRERIFEPLGMRGTLLRHSDIDYLPNSAANHMKTTAGVYEKWGCMDFGGDGAMASTIDDLLRWLAHMDAPKIGSAATWSMIKSPQQVANGTSTGYGLGLLPGRYRGVDTFQHSGPWFGANSHFAKVPAAGLDVVVLVNRSDVSAVALASKVLDACIAQLEPATETAAGPLAAGMFRSPATGRAIRLFAQAGRQFLSIDGKDLPAQFVAPGVFGLALLASTPNQTVTLVGDPARPTAIRYSDFGNIEEFKSVPAVDKPDARAIVGRYRSESTGTEAAVTRTDQGARWQTTGRFGSMVYDLEGQAEGVWKVTSASMPFLGGMVTFEDDRRTCRFSDLLTLALPFRRVA